MSRTYYSGRRAYYGGYFGRVAGIVNPCNPYWTKAGYWSQEEEDSQYCKYLLSMYELFKEAATAAYEQRGYTTFERKKCVRGKDYEALEATANYYYERYKRASK